MALNHIQTTNAKPRDKAYKPAAEKRVETLARKVAADNTFKTIAAEWVAKISVRVAHRSRSTRFAGCSAWPIR